MMRVAVIGATGLIGGFVTRRLRRVGEVVTVGRRADCDRLADLSKPETVARLDLEGVDALVHCAGVVDEDFRADPVGAFVQSSVGMSTLVERCITLGIGTVVYFSTAHVYGPLVGRISEQTPVNPLSDYAVAHYTSEQTLKRYVLQGHLAGLVLRPEAVYGIPTPLKAFDRWHLIPYSFPMEAVDRQEIVLRTSGTQSRNFVGADDVALYVDSYLASRSRPGTFTVLNPKGLDTLSVYEFAVKCAQHFSKITGKPCKISVPPASNRPGLEDHSYDSVHDLHRAQDRLDAYLDALLRVLIAAKTRKEEHEY